MSRRIPRIDPAAPDEDLVDQAKSALDGDMRAFEMLIARHQGHVLSNCRSLSGSEADGEDLAQEVFVKAYFGIARFEGRSRFRTWIQRIKVNHCLNFLRRKKGKTFLDVDDPVTQSENALQVEVSAEKQTRSMSEREGVREVLESLPDTLRIPLTMCDMDGFSYQEIADELGIGLSATKMRIKRGREEFRRRYRQLEEALPTVE